MSWKLPENQSAACDPAGRDPGTKRPIPAALQEEQSMMIDPNPSHLAREIPRVSDVLVS